MHNRPLASAAQVSGDHAVSRRSRAVGLALVPILAALSCGAARASTVVDQDYEVANSNGSFSNFTSGFRDIQTFTVGVTGTLSDIDVFTDFTPSLTNLTLSIYTTDTTGAPTSTVLASGLTISKLTPQPVRDVPGYAISFATDLAVTAGEVLAFEPILTADADLIPWVSTYDGFPDFPGLYANGATYYQDSTTGGKLVRDPYGDQDFRTFVTTGGVPEPTTWAMMLMGVFGLGAVLRHARRSTPAAVTLA